MHLHGSEPNGRSRLLRPVQRMCFGYLTLKLTAGLVPLFGSTCDHESSRYLAQKIRKNAAGFLSNRYLVVAKPTYTSECGGADHVPKTNRTFRPALPGPVRGYGMAWTPTVWVARGNTSFRLPGFLPRIGITDEPTNVVPRHLFLPGNRTNRHSAAVVHFLELLSPLLIRWHGLNLKLDSLHRICPTSGT